MVLGRYRIVRVLAFGGQGVVCLARGEGAAGFARPVVIKQVLAGLAHDMSRREQLAREARIMAQLRHPGIVSVIEFAEEDDSYFLVLDYVHGFDLGRWSRFVRKKRGLMPVELAVHAVVQVLEALQYAHSLPGPDGQPLGIIHRDISPGNILIDAEGPVKLTDFGVASMRSDVTEGNDPGQIKGKLAYIAPEILQGRLPDQGSDCYSCAVVLHELLVGTNEFRGTVPTATAMRVLSHDPSRVEEVRRDVGAALGEVLATALRKEPSERFTSAKEFAAALRNTLTVGAAELAEEFARTVAQDFFDPALPRMLGMPDLHTLERAWREPTEGLPALNADDFPELVAEEPPPRPRLPAWVLAVGMGAVGITGGLLLGLREEDPADSVVYVHSEPAPDEAAAEGPSDPGQAPSSANSERPRTKKRKPRSREASLTRAFARRQGQVERCFTKHGASKGQISVRFVVDRKGRVTEAEVLPEQVGDSTLGRCLARVARGARFGKQPRAMSFRIPIVTRSGG